MQTLQKAVDAGFARAAHVTKIAGRHQLLMGAHFRRDLVNYLPQQEQSAGLTNPVANWTAAFSSSAGE